MLKCAMMRGRGRRSGRIGNGEVNLTRRPLIRLSNTRLDNLVPGCAAPGAGIREGTAVAETDIGPEDPAATIAPAGPPDPAAPREHTPRERESRPPASGAQEGQPRRGSWLVIAVPAATSAVVGGYELGGPSLWRDEAYTKDAIGRSVSQIF